MFKSLHDSLSLVSQRNERTWGNERNSPSPFLHSLLPDCRGEMDEMKNEQRTNSQLRERMKLVGIVQRFLSARNLFCPDSSFYERGIQKKTEHSK